jgi:hypothetical protein
VARVGSFTGMAGGPYGAALGTVHPADNYVPTEQELEAGNLLHDIPGVSPQPPRPEMPPVSRNSLLPTPVTTPTPVRYSFPTTAPSLGR